MVKNEEDNLDRCLKSLQPIRDAVDSELVIVDTGSEDNTVEIAKKYTDKIYFHPWNNDFSAMRNITISYATGKWILIMDADEEMLEYQEIINFIKSPKSEKYGAIAISGKNITDLDNPEAYSILVNFRLFKNDGYFHYAGAVHNQPVFKGKELIISALLAHYGYLANDGKLMEKKYLRTSSILKNELEKDPNNIYYWTQLSVTYGMHNDYDQAIECAEKAYELYHQQKLSNGMYVFSNLAMMYQMTRNFKRVEEVCLEALTLKDGFIDIYYYLAEAQAILKKQHDSIKHYLKYLQLLDAYDNVVQRDISVIEYTLGNREVAYYNLSNLYNRAEEYELALHYAEKISDKKSIHDNFSTIVFLYIKLSKFDALGSYYHQRVELEHQADFYEQLNKIKKGFSNEYKLAIANVFKDVENYYGLLCNLIIEDHEGYISTKSQETANQINLAELPVYCSEILYYLLKGHHSLTKMITNFKETWLSCAFDYIVKQQDDLCEQIYRYLERNPCGNELSEYKLSKSLCRYALLLNVLSTTEYNILFERYIEDGVAYLQKVYNIYILDNMMIYEMKNDEEVFLLYMFHAQMNKDDQEKYAKYLRNALQAFPGMKNGIEILLNQLQSRKTAYESEFDSYKVQVKGTIKELIESGKLDEAKIILNEYKSIVSNDMEAILLESKILLN